MISRSLSPSLNLRTTFKRLRNVFAALAAVGLLAAAFFFTRARAATTYTWNQTGAGDWQVSTNWTPARTLPAADDVLVFNNGATTTVTNVPTATTVGQLSVSGNTKVTLQAAAGGSVLSVGGGAGTDLSVASGSQLNA
ncbi:MAG: hypothetical protein M3268_04975, partial [Acidobacteriota bacterium]|nr:hypothetical protein [Acidobacteriota bacterium]